MNIVSIDGPQGKGQYEKFSYLSKGGMGEVYTAFDKINNNEVAIKFILKDNSQTNNQFESEFIIAKNLDHPNIVRTFHFGEVTIENSQYYFSIMEYVKGGNLRTYLMNSVHPIPLDEALAIMMQLADGLAKAHETIVHRDLKPENVLLTIDKIVKLCDFGISKFILESTRTQTFKGFGTYYYMAPECWLLDTNTPSMDVYSLGIMFFEILTGKLPFNGSTVLAIRDQHLYSPLPDISKIRKDIPIKLIQIIGKMCNKRPKDRYSNGGDVFKALQGLDTLPSTNVPNGILEKANQIINRNKAAALLQEKTKNDSLVAENLLQYSVDELFIKFKNVIDNINDSLEEEKISYEQQANKITFSFYNKTLSIDFSHQDFIKSYIEGAKEKSIQNQLQMYGMVMSAPTELYLSKDGVKLIGYIEDVSDQNQQVRFGANLLLLKSDPTDIYGEWYCCWFNDNGLMRSNYKHYAIRGNEFYKEYEFGRSGIMHVRSMEFKYLDDTLIHEFIDYLFT